MRSALGLCGRLIGGVWFALAVGWLAPNAAMATDERLGPAKRVVTVLAAENLRGRGNGTPEIRKARDLVRQWMADAKLKPGAREDWLQHFEGPDRMAMANVVGKVEGQGDEWVLVGAHLDGLGIGKEGDDAGRVFPGADDNASGIAALLAIAGELAHEKDLERTVYFVAFEGEEIGLLGSRAFVASPPMALEKCAAMINLDTVGRMEANRLIVFGAESAAEFPAILRGVASMFEGELALNTSGAWASDHTPFFEKGIPVLHAFTGANPDYHRPSDTADKVNVDGIVTVADYFWEVVLHLATTPSRPTFVPGGAPKAAGGGQAARRVSLGTIPDFAQSSGGVKLQGVMPESAAEEAGLQAGDVIVAIDEAAIDTIEDFQAALAARAPGDRIAVKFVRAGETKTADAVLRERK